MTPAERQKLIEELEQINAENAREMQLLEQAPLDEVSGATKDIMPSPSSLMGWNEDHSIAGEQSSSYRDKKRADEQVEEARETMSQDGSMIGNVIDSYEGALGSVKDTAESIVGAIDGPTALTATLMTPAVIEGANYLMSGGAEAKGEASRNALTKMDEKISGEGLEKGKSNPLSAMDDFKARLTQEGIDYDDLKSRPGTMREKLEAVYKEQLAKKYPTWASKTGMGKIGRMISGANSDEPSPRRAQAASYLKRGAGLAMAAPAVYGIADSFGAGKK